MKDLHGKTAIITGANGGLGNHLTRVLATEGVNLLLVAYPGVGLDELSREMGGLGVKASFLVADLRKESEVNAVVERARAEFGTVDLLVNNAGVEYTCRFHELTPAQIKDVLAVNLEAPMALTRALLPGMLERRCGHIINISSLAGKAGTPYQEPYVATKAALTLFTFSLRASYAGSGVSASVVCPGFVEAGIYPRIKARARCSAPLLLAGNRPERVANAMLRAIRRDVPEIIVNRFPVRPMLALAALSPALGARIVAWMGVNLFFRRAAEAESGLGN